MTDIGKLLNKHIPTKKSVSGFIPNEYKEVPINTTVNKPSLTPLKQDSYLVSTIEVVERLTPRELSVFNLIVHGYGNKEMGTELNIQVKTIEKHRQNIYNKLNIHSVAGLVWLYLTKNVPINFPYLTRAWNRVKCSTPRKYNNVEKLYDKSLDQENKNVA
jgi:DNA-binding CsgD family transcriptional regulator